MNRIVAYTRVSTNKQKTDRQRLLIEEYCSKNNIVVDEWYEDTISGKVFNRPEYNRLKEEVKSGDTVIVSSIDRLGRDWEQNKVEYKTFLNNDINLKFCDYSMLDIDTTIEDTDLSNKLIKSMMIDVLCYGAEMERKKISERTKDSLRAKKIAGDKLGKRRELDYESVVALYDDGSTIEEIADVTGYELYNIRRIISKEKGLTYRELELMKEEDYANSNEDEKLTVERAYDLVVNQKMNVSSVARIFNMSRQAVSMKVKRYEKKLIKMEAKKRAK